MSRICAGVWVASWLLVLSGCALMQPMPTLPPPTTSPLALPMLQPGGSVQMPLDASGPTVAVPYLTLDIEVVDATMGQRVDAAIAIDGYEMWRGCCGKLVIEAMQPHTLTVQAEGYVLWSVTLNPNIRHNAMMRVPVELTPER